MIFIFISIVLFLYVAIRINYNIYQNHRVIEYINTLDLNNNDIGDFNYYPKIEIFQKDYVGMLSIDLLSMNIPVESSCTNHLQSICMYKENKLIFIASNLVDSISNYKSIDIGNILSFKNFFGENIKYTIEQIKHTNNLNELDKFSANLILIVKDYYKTEYIIFLCN